ncbi:hypothetical protein PINS_up001952 [Pythium insidiosum]|nr:hypothetical protein PINS_up001952 [Pythium insidiosum]
MTAINGIPLTGCTYTEVLDRVNRLPRPLRIKFADISKGIVGRVKELPPEEETEEQREARLARSRQSDLRLEYFQLLVAHELQLQVWHVSKNRMAKKEQELARKIDILSNQLVAMQEFQGLLEKEKESLDTETESLQSWLDRLKAQETGQLESAEVAKTVELQERQAVLDKEIGEMIAENDQLRAEKATLEGDLDATQDELNALGDLEDTAVSKLVDELDVFSTGFLGSYVERGSIDRFRR